MINPINPDIKDVLDRIGCHAWGTANASDSAVLADYLWSLEKGGPTGDIETIKNEIIILLEYTNIIINKNKYEPHQFRSIAYYINGMIVQCLQINCFGKPDLPIKKALVDLGWSITCGWDAILAGDITNLAEHIELERAARSREKGSDWEGLKGGGREGDIQIP